MVVSCFICENNNKANSSLGYFSFPNDERLCALWFKAISRPRLSIHTAGFCHKKFRLCSKHFHSKDVSVNKIRKRLHPDAVPDTEFQASKPSASVNETSDQPSSTSYETDSFQKDMPRHKCVYLHCSTRSGEQKSLFQFPKDRTRAEIWAKAAGREDLLQKNISTYKICEDHFEKKWVSISASGMKRVYNEAVPSIFRGPKRSLMDNATGELSKKIVVLSDIALMQSPSNIKNISQGTFPLQIDMDTLPSTSRSCNNSPVVPPTASTQTPAHLSSNTPHKTKPKYQVRSLERNISDTDESSEKASPSKEITLEDIFKFLDDRYPQEATASIKTQLASLDETTKETRPDTSSSAKRPRPDEQLDEAQCVVTDPAELQIKIEECELPDEEIILESEAALSTTTTTATSPTVNDEIKKEDDTDDEAMEAKPPERHHIQAFFDSMAVTVMQFPPPLAVRAKVDVLQVISRLELEMWQSQSGPSTSTAPTYFNQSYCTEKLISSSEQMPKIL